MISIIALAIGLIALLIVWRRAPAACVAGFFVLFSLLHRMITITYLDIAGPVYATELNRHVGGNDAAPMFVVSVLAFLVPIAVLLRSRAVTAGAYSALPPEIPYHRLLGRGALITAIALLAFLYLDMIRIGTIPLLSGMDRLAYDDIAGFAHGPMYELNFLFSAMLGAMTALARLRGQSYDLRFGVLLMVLLAYWALTGNRFSAFFVSLSFFAMPMAAVVAMLHAHRLAHLRRETPFGALLSVRVWLPLLAVFSSLAVVGLLFNSYYEVRDYADPLFEISQRLLIQPVQLWATTWEFAGPDWGVNHRTIDYVLLNPPDAGSNTSIRYLMELELGYFRAYELIDLGQQYAGGYPEILFHLFGFYASVPIMVALGIAAAALLRLATANLVKGRVMTSLMAIYLFYGFGVFYIGGMLNFLLAPSYFVKIALLIIVYLAEKYWLSRGQASRAAHAPMHRRYAPSPARARTS